jgi:Tfp pilus assembly protein PilO
MIQLSQLRFDIRQSSRGIALGLVALALLNLGFYMMYTRPAVSEYQRLEATTRPDFDEINNLEDVVERLEVFREGLSQAEADLERLRDEVLSTRDARLVDVQSEVADLCEEFKIDLDSVNYGSELLLNEELDRLEMLVPLQGGYSNLRKFLQAVEHSDKFLLVERVALGQGKQGGRMLDLNIDLATYFRAPQELIDRNRADGRGRGRRRM